MALSYAFSPDKGETPQTIAQRRQMSNLIAARMLGTAPKNVGEGINAIGQALIARSMMGDADAAQKAGEASLPDFLKSQIMGQPAAPAAPSVSTPMGSTSIPSGEIDPRLSSAIGTAASSSGVDPAYMTRLALVENGGKVEGGSTLSSAQGPFQFLSGTAKQYGLTNPNDPAASADAAARLTLDNKAALTQALGREPTPGELYLAHQQGAGGAIKLLQNPNAPVESVIGAQAARNNAATPGMTAGQFTNKWAGKFGDIVQTVDPNQKNIIDAQADGPMAFAGQPAPMQPVAPQPPAGAASADMAVGSPAAAPAAVQPAAATQNRFLFKNASDEDLQKALVNPFTPENIRTALTQEYKLRADAAQKANDPLRNAQIIKAQRDLQLVGEPYHDTDGNLVQKDASGKVTMLSAADKRPTSVGEYGFYADQEIKAGRTPLPYGQWDVARRRSGATNVNTGTIPKGYEQIQDPVTGAVSMRPIPGGPADTSKQDQAKADAQAISGNVVINAARQARDAINAAGLPAAGSGTSVLSNMGETNAAELRRQIDVLKANASIETLNQMRQMSKTGGALGSVTEGEERLLAAKSGAIDPSAPKDKVIAAINDYERTLLETVHGKAAGDKIFEASRKTSAPTATQGVVDGLTAINPQTGERLIRQNGKWVPFT